MFIEQYIDFSLINDVKFLWHFEKYWDDDNVIISLIKCLDNPNSLLELYNDKNKWHGCFGSMAIITHSFLTKLVDNHNIFILLDHVIGKGLRCIFETVFGLICSLYSNVWEYPSMYGIMHDYMQWGYSYEQYIEDTHSNNIKLPIIKVWTGR
jgi:hypothetical protein